MRTTAHHAGDRSEEWKAPRAPLVPNAATDRMPALADLGRVRIVVCLGDAFDDCQAEADTCTRCEHRLASGIPRGILPWP